MIHKQAKVIFYAVFIILNQRMQKNYYVSLDEPYLNGEFSCDTERGIVVRIAAC